MRASRWGGRLGCLEATYEESKLFLRGEPYEADKSLEATYEESKQGTPGVPGGPLPQVWKLPMRNPSTVVTSLSLPPWAGLEATHEESKLVKTTPKGKLSGHVWKLPMRNPS